MSQHGERQMPQTAADLRCDVLVVGGGPAGLSGAVALARSRRSVLVVDAGEPRNAAAGHAHNVLGREGVVPAQLLADGRAELVGYGGRVVTSRATSVERLEGLGGGSGGFRVGLSDGRAVVARRLMLTTGLVDELPEVPGLAERWGRDVLHCPFCHGWEVRDQVIGVLATGPAAVHQSQMFRELSHSVTMLTHTGPALSDEQAEQLAARGITVVGGEVAGLVVEDDRLAGVRLRSGHLVPLQALVVAPFFRARADLLTGLGVDVVPMRMGEAVVASHVAAGPTGATTVPGVWVAGNVAVPHAQVMASAAAGLTAGAAIHGDLITEDVQAAVAMHRDATTEDPWRAVGPGRWDERYSGGAVGPRSMAARWSVAEARWVRS